MDLHSHPSTVDILSNPTVPSSRRHTSIATNLQSYGANTMYDSIKYFRQSPSSIAAVASASANKRSMGAFPNTRTLVAAFLEALTERGGQASNLPARLKHNPHDGGKPYSYTL